MSPLLRVKGKPSDSPYPKKLRKDASTISNALHESTGLNSDSTTQHHSSSTNQGCNKTITHGRCYRSEKRYLLKPIKQKNNDRNDHE
ncbi:hypothetical protein TNCV_4993271 [Trichonephila clavipes]|nr:hypothetical protein TNCV_4993271 [Trichonephila clavipes]